MHTDGRGNGIVQPATMREKIYKISDGRFKCPRCSFKFNEFIGIYLEHLQIPFNELSHLLYLFVLGVPSYSCRGYLSVSLETAQRLYALFRQTIDDNAMIKIHEMVLAGEIKTDETLYGGDGSALIGHGLLREKGCGTFKIFCYVHGSESN